MVTLRDWLVVYAKGIAMGCADAVPGVSGGTIALITGIYERLIAAVTEIDPERIRRVLAGVRPANLPDARAAFHEVDGMFLLVLGAGIGTALVTVLRLVHYLLEEFPVFTFGFFFGLIAASAVVLFSEVDVSTPRRKAAALGGFSAAFLTSGYASTAVGHELPVVLVAGAIAVSAMILPGISGSLLLIIIGQYEYMSGALSRFVDALIGVLAGDGIGPAVDAAPPVVTFLIGGVVGLFTIAHAVRRALERYRMATIAFLVSLVVGALRAPVVETGVVIAERGRTWPAVLPTFVAAGAVGAALVFVLDRFGGSIEY